MRTNLLLISGTIIIAILLVVVSGCTEIQSYLPSPSPASGPVHSEESSPISKTQNVAITRSGSTITASGQNPYNTVTKKDPFLLKEGKATITVSLKGGGYGCSVNLDYKSSSSQYFDYVPVYTMDSTIRTMEVTKTVLIPYTQDYYLDVNWGDEWKVTIVQ